MIATKTEGNNTVRTVFTVIDTNLAVQFSSIRNHVLRKLTVSGTRLLIPGEIYSVSEIIVNECFAWESGILA